MKWDFIFAAIAIGIMAHRTPAMATVIRVPAEQPTIQAGIDVSVDGDTVLVADGSFAGEGNHDLDPQGKSIVITSENGAETCIIQLYDGERGFNVHTSEPMATMIRGFTMQGQGFGEPQRMGILWTSAAFTFDSSVFQDTHPNDALLQQVQGGVILCTGAALTIESCVFKDTHPNDSWVEGGLIAFINSSARLYDCEIRDNLIEGDEIYGGGIYAINSDIELSSSVIANNTCNLLIDMGMAYGAGLYADGGAVRVYDSIIQNNIIGSLDATHFGGEGGGLHCSEATLINCVVSGNRVNNGGSNYGRGGGLHGGNFTLLNCLLTDNHASGSRGERGSIGAIYCTNCTMKNCTIADNSAVPGLTDVFIDTAVIENAIVWDSFFIRNQSITYSDMWQEVTGTGNLNVDPLFTIGARGSYYLSQTAAGQSETSQCVDAGIDLASSICFDLPYGPVCLDGMTTRTDAVGDAGVADLGFHYPPTAPAPATITPTPTPTETAAPSLTPTPTSLPLTSGVILQMSSHYFSPGDPCWLTAELQNAGAPLEDVPLFILLDIAGQNWFWDDWTQNLDYTRVNLPTGDTVADILSPFVWPDTGRESLLGITFWGALIDEDNLTIIGGDEGIGSWIFGYGPQ